MIPKTRYCFSTVVYVYFVLIELLGCHEDQEHLDAQDCLSFLFLRFDSYRAWEHEDWEDLIGHWYARYDYRTSREKLDLTFDQGFELIVSDCVGSWWVWVEGRLQYSGKYLSYVFQLNKNLKWMFIGKHKSHRLPF